MSQFIEIPQHCYAGKHEIWPPSESCRYCGHKAGEKYKASSVALEMLYRPLIIKTEAMIKVLGG